MCKIYKIFRLDREQSFNKFFFCKHYPLPKIVPFSNPFFDCSVSIRRLASRIKEITKKKMFSFTQKHFLYNIFNIKILFCYISQIFDWFFRRERKREF